MNSHSDRGCLLPRGHTPQRHPPASPPAPGSGPELLSLIPLPWENSQRFLLCRKPLPRADKAPLQPPQAQHRCRPGPCLEHRAAVPATRRAPAPAAPHQLKHPFWVCNRPQAAVTGWAQGLETGSAALARTWALFTFVFPYEHFLILMSYSFCLLQLVEGAGQLKHPDILYIYKTWSYHLSERWARTPRTVLLPLLH